MSHIITCPYCRTHVRVSAGITGKKLICPHCLADMDNAGPERQIRAADINTDVKRDLSAGSIVLAVLIGLCVFGIAMVFFGFQGSKGSNDAFFFLFLLVIFCAALNVLVSIAIIRRGIQRTRFSTAAKVLGITFLVAGTTAAIYIFIFLTCLRLVIIHGPYNYH